MEKLLYPTITYLPEKAINRTFLSTRIFVVLLMLRLLVFLSHQDKKVSVHWIVTGTRCKIFIEKRIALTNEDGVSLAARAFTKQISKHIKIDMNIFTGSGGGWQIW